MGSLLNLSNISMEITLRRHIHLEHDGKLLLLNIDGTGPAIPRAGRTTWDGGEFLIRLPSPTEAEDLGLTWTEIRRNNFQLGNDEHEIIIASPNISWPENWAWKDAVISDSAVDPVARESVYRTLHRVVSKVIIQNSKSEILLAKVRRGFFSGCWTLPGGFVDYSEHPRTGAVREVKEELGLNITIADPKSECGEEILGNDGALIQQAIFGENGLSWLSFSYHTVMDIQADQIIPKDDEIEKAEWFSLEAALEVAVSAFDIEAIRRIIEK